MESNPEYITATGLEKLKQRLEHLKTVRRPEIARQIHDAKEEGDISENAGYEIAKHNQALLEGEISDLESTIKRAVIIEDNHRTDEVSIGSKVTVVEVGEEDFPETFRIVGSSEAAPSEGRISNESPVGAALLGHAKNDEVIVETPGGKVRFRIVDIQ